MNPKITIKPATSINITTLCQLLKLGLILFSGEHCNELRCRNDSSCSHQHLPTRPIVCVWIQFYPIWNPPLQLAYRRRKIVFGSCIKKSHVETVAKLYGKLHSSHNKSRRQLPIFAQSVEYTSAAKSLRIDRAKTVKSQFYSIPTRIIHLFRLNLMVK